MASGSLPVRPAQKKTPKPLFESGRLLALVLVGAFVLALLLVLAFRASTPVVATTHLAFLSVVTFLAFGWDKWSAKSGTRRVSEFNLVALAFLGGAAGGLLAVTIFRHKTQRPLFTIGFPTFLFAHVVLILVLVLK